MLRSVLFLFMMAPFAIAADAPAPRPLSDVKIKQVKPASFDPPLVLDSKSGFAIYLPPDDVKNVEYIGLDGEEPFPVSLIGGSKTAFVLFTRGLPAKNYRFVGVASDAGGTLTRKQFSVPVGVPPVVTPPPKKEDPPVTTPALYYFAVVRPNGPASADFTKCMQDPAWATLRKQGHTVKDFTVSGASESAVPIPNGATLPLVVIFKGADGSQVLKSVDFPTTSADILKLPSKGSVK